MENQEQTQPTLEDQLKTTAPVVIGEFQPHAIVSNSAVFEHLQRVGKMYAASQWVPDHYKGKVADCTIAISLACTLKVNPVIFLQRTYPVKGRIGFEGQLATALVNVSGKFAHSLRFDVTGTGDDLEVTAWTMSRDGVRLEGKFGMKAAKALGLAGKDMYRAIPEQKCGYMAALMFARRHCPELLMGMMATEEMEATPEESPTIEVVERLTKRGKEV